MNNTVHKIYITSFFIAGIALAVFITADGFSYYSTSISERFFHPQHNFLKPSGSFGHGYGIAGSLMLIIGVSVYMIRKRIRRFHNFGYLKYWLEFHIFLCTAGPLLILFHTSFKFGGIVAVSFWSMTAVVLSGFIGRFLYLQIPRTIKGKELDIKQLEEENESLTSDIKNSYSVDDSIIEKINNYSLARNYKSLSAGKAVMIILKDYFSLRSFISDIRMDLRKAGVPAFRKKDLLKKIKQQIILKRRAGLLHNMQKLFKYWHIVHLPFAVVMFVIMFIHIVVTIIFGYRWIF